MARALTAASSMYLSQASSPITAYPLTIAGWFNPTGVVGNQVICQGVGKNGSDGTALLYLKATHLSAFSNDGGASSEAVGTATVSAAAWCHGCAVFAGATDRRIYTNGTDKQTNAGSRAIIGSPDRMAIGTEFAAAGVSNFFGGSLAEVAVWNVALDDGEALALGKGVSPLLIRPSALIAYWPLAGISSPEPDGWKSRLDMTLTNAPTKADHVPMLYPADARVA